MLQRSKSFSSLSGTHDMDGSKSLIRKIDNRDDPKDWLRHIHTYKLWNNGKRPFYPEDPVQTALRKSKEAERREHVRRESFRPSVDVDNRCCDDFDCHCTYATIFLEGRREKLGEHIEKRLLIEKKLLDEKKRSAPAQMGEDVKPKSSKKSNRHRHHLNSHRPSPLAYIQSAEEDEADAKDDTLSEDVSDDDSVATIYNVSDGQCEEDEDDHLSNASLQGYDEGIKDISKFHLWPSTSASGINQGSETRNDCPPLTSESKFNSKDFIGYDWTSTLQSSAADEEEQKPQKEMSQSSPIGQETCSLPTQLTPFRQEDFPMSFAEALVINSARMMVLKIGSTIDKAVAQLQACRNKAENQRPNASANTASKFDREIVFYREYRQNLDFDNSRCEKNLHGEQQG